MVVTKKEGEREGERGTEGEREGRGRGKVEGGERKREGGWGEREREREREISKYFPCTFALQESGELSHSEVQDIINIANEVAEHTRLVDAAVLTINEVLQEDNADKTLEALQNGALDLSEVFPENKEYYHAALLAKRQSKDGRNLTEEEVQEVIREMNEKARHDRNGKNKHIN